MNLPYGCVMVAVNESSRKVILDFMKPDRRENINRNQPPTHSRSQRLSASLLSGCFAGAVAALLTTPLDVIKTRLQTQNLVSQTLTPGPVPPLACPGFKQAKRHIVSSSKPVTIGAPLHAVEDIKMSQVNNTAHSTGASAGLRYHSMAQTFRSVVKEEGYIALLTGAVPRILVNAPSVAISWTAYEFAKSVLADS